MFSVDLNIKGLKDVYALSEDYSEGLLYGFRKGMIYVEGTAKKRFDTPGNLKAQTGHYRRSITTSVSKTTDGMLGTLHGNVIYAAIHETGGIIYPKKGKYLRFPIQGNWVSVKKVVIKARPLLVPSAEESLDMVGEIIVNEIVKRASED